MLVAGNGLRMSNWVDWGERTGGQRWSCGRARGTGVARSWICWATGV